MTSLWVFAKKLSQFNAQAAFFLQHKMLLSSLMLAVRAPCCRYADDQCQTDNYPEQYTAKTVSSSDSESRPATPDRAK